MGDQSKMNQSAKDWCKVVVCATRWLGRVIHLIENTDNQIEIFSKQKLSSGTSWLQCNQYVRLNWKCRYCFKFKNTLVDIEQSGLE